MKEVIKAFADFGWELRLVNDYVVAGTRNTGRTNTDAFFSISIAVSLTEMSIVVNAVDSERWRAEICRKVTQFSNIEQAARAADDMYRKMLNVVSMLED